MINTLGCFHNLPEQPSAQSILPRGPIWKEEKKDEKKEGISWELVGKAKEKEKRADLLRQLNESRKNS